MGKKKTNLGNDFLVMLLGLKQPNGIVTGTRKEFSKITGLSIDTIIRRLSLLESNGSIKIEIEHSVPTKFHIYDIKIID